MKHSLYYKFILGYLVFGLVAFLAVATVASELTYNQLMKEESAALYDEASVLAARYSQVYKGRSLTIDSVSPQLEAVSTYLRAEIWIVNRRGTIVVDSRNSSRTGMIIEGFDPVLNGNQPYTIGTYNDCFTEDVMTVSAPITGNYTTYGYVLIHLPLRQIHGSKDRFLNILYIVSGIILKKTKMFAGDPAPFVMELPAYHLPTVGNVLRSMWERGWSFIKKAGTIILLSTIFVWFTTYFGWVDGQFRMLEDMEIDHSILASIGNIFAWIFAPLGWGDWKSAVAAITGLVAKENVVGTFGILFGFAEVAEDGSEIWGTLSAHMTAAAAYSFLVFNLLCAPCFAAMGAIKREMNNIKWFWFAIGYQCLLAYVAALCIYQIGTWLTVGSFGLGTVAALILVAGFLYLLLRPSREHSKVKMKGLASI